MRKNLRRQASYEKREWIYRFLLSAAAVLFLAFFFYRSLWAAPPLAGVGAGCFRELEKRDARRKRQETAAQFRECILSVATLLQAGYSAESAFLECLSDMELLFGEKAAICRELRKIKRGLDINISLEELLLNMAENTECEEILQFAQIFGLAKRNGGNMPEIIQSSAGLIGKQIELRQETEAMLGGKKLELTIMRIMPFAILLYIEAGSPGYFTVLYHNLQGIVIMTGCLLMYLAAYGIGEHIMNRLWEELA